jgi:hypothetical protein
MAPKWEKGAPVCLSCLFKITSLKTVRVKENRIRTGRSGRSWGWWIGLLLAVFAGIYLALL